MRPRPDSLLGFTAVPVRARRDGWSHGVQVAFIAYLRVTGCVEEACRRVGRSRESAYKLYRRPDAAGFREAWEAALAGATAAPATRKLPPIASTSASGSGARRAGVPVPPWSLLGMMAALAAPAEGKCNPQLPQHRQLPPLSGEPSTSQSLFPPGVGE